MSEYNHPYRDAAFVIDQLIGFDAICQRAHLDDINSELATVILTEAAKLGSGVLAPLNRDGDLQGATLGSDGVEETPGFAAAYRQFMDGGWAGLTADPDYDGQGLPNLLGTAVNEIWHSANMAFALCPMLSQGATEAIAHHGSEALKAQYLPHLISGAWTGTMNLTEPDAGSDLSAIKTRAVPEQDHYLISGQKIFITWGDHQMTDNIVHLVLARLPDAPAGVKGISLFVVPKFLLDDNGQPAARNDVHCISLEHKLGIHGSPTCVMSFGDQGGAVGYLVGEANKGLSYMFTMMNHARQTVGLQGLAISERSYQQALEYAKERLQGADREGNRLAIIKYPDVRRMLMQMKSSTEAMRALAYTAAVEQDLAAFTEGAESDAHLQRVALYTPIIKGWLTELAQEITYTGIQIHGGMGFSEETGSAQHYRDARILTIYEGTTGIQALDFIGRKVLLDGAAELTALLGEMQQTAVQLAELPAAQAGILNNFADALEKALLARDWVLQHAASDKEVMGRVSHQFLMLFGYLSGGWVMARSALAAQAQLASNSGDQTFLAGKLASAQFYAEQILPRVDSCFKAIQSGASMAVDEALL